MKTNKFIEWILTSPQAFKVLMYMGAIMGVVITLAFTILFTVLEMYVLAVFAGIFCGAASYKVYKYLKARKELGNDEFAGYTAAEMMGYTIENDDKDLEESTDGNKTECTEQSNADDGQPAQQEHNGTTKRVSESDEESERADFSFGELIQESDLDEPEFRNTP